MICWVLAPTCCGFPLPCRRRDVGRLTHLLLIEVPSALDSNRTVDQPSSTIPAVCQELCTCWWLVLTAYPAHIAVRRSAEGRSITTASCALRSQGKRPVLLPSCR